MLKHAIRRNMHVRVQSMGKASYENILNLQKKYQNQLMRGDAPEAGRLLLVEHEPAVYTSGRASSKIESNRDDILKTSRGGQVTWHGPGQVVMYPILDLSKSPPFRKDLRWYVNSVEEVAFRVLNTFGLIGSRHCEHTGVWIGNKKVAAIGISVSKWVTMHGMALNVCNDLEPFYDRIVPCGIEDEDLGVTTISNELSRDVTVDEVTSRVLDMFQEVFCVRARSVRTHPARHNVPMSPQN